MFIQGAPPSKRPPLRRRRDREQRRAYHQRPTMTPHAQRLRLLLQMVDIRNQTEMMMRNWMQVTATAAIQAASLIQQAMYDVYVRMQRLLKTSTQEIISTIDDAPNRFQKFMGGAASFLHHDESSTVKKFDALESELRMLKEQMALLIQGQNNNAQTRTETSSSSSVPSAPPCPAVPAPPPRPSAWPSSKSPSSIAAPQMMTFLDELICSDVSDDSEGEEDIVECTNRKSRIPGEGVPSIPSRSRSNISDRQFPKKNQPSFAEQIQERNRVGLRKTRVDRSPGGTPLKRSSHPGSDGFHQEILANALFRKFQNVRADESPERRRAKKHERNNSASSSHGLASLFEGGEVDDDEWSDKENS